VCLLQDVVSGGQSVIGVFVTGCYCENWMARPSKFMAGMSKCSLKAHYVLLRDVTCLAG
jgi:hypothetical protein